MIRTIILALGATICLMACDNLRTVVPLEVPDIDDQLVVNSLFTTDSTWSVLVTGHRYVLDDHEIPFIKGATVTLMAGTEELASVSNGDSGYYHLPVTPEVSVDYTLKVTHPKYPDAEANVRLNPPVKLSSFEIEVPDDISFEGNFKGSITLADPPNERNYYQLILTSIGEYPSVIDEDGDTLWQSFTNTVFIQLGTEQTDFKIDLNADIFSFMPGAVFTDEFINGKNVTIPFEFLNSGSFLPEGSKWKINAEFQSLSEEYYKYAYSYGVQQNASGNPFAQPAQVYTNIEGGLGVVAGYARSKVETIILD